jgi:hypothetical protein
MMLTSWARLLKPNFLNPLKKTVIHSMKAKQTSPPKFSIPGILKRVWLLMTPQEHRRAGFIFIGIFINSFVDILGLAAVVPVIGLVIEPGLIHSNDYLARAFEMTSSIGIDTERKFLMFASIGLIAAFYSRPWSISD